MPLLELVIVICLKHVVVVIRITKEAFGLT